MKKYIRRIAMLLAVLMLFMSVFVACKGDDDDDDDDDGGWSLGDSGKAATPDNIPEDTDLEGYQFNIKYRQHAWLKNYECEGNIEGDAVNPVHRTVYERNLRVQRRLNCKLKFIATNSGAPGEAATEIRNTLDAEDYYDFFMLTNNTVVSSRRNHQLVDFNDAEYVEYHQPWWWEDVMTELAFDGHTINYLVGDINSLNIGTMSAFYFNFDLVEQYLQKKPQYFYDLVNEKKWTIAKVDELAAQCYRNLNGNNEEDDGDMFAFPWTGSEVANQLLMSTKVADTFYTRDDSGLIKINMKGNNDIYRLVEQVRHLLRDNAGVKDIHTLPMGAFDRLILDEFASNKYVFLVQRLTGACDAALIGMQSLYGILPYPTLDEGDEYLSHIQAASTNICAPKVAEKNLEIIGICIEALCSEAYRYTTDAFFNMALKNKYTNDIESAKMVDIIYNSAHKSFLVEYSSAANGITGCLNAAIEGETNVMTLIDQKGGAEQAINNYIAETKASLLGYQ